MAREFFSKLTTFSISDKFRRISQTSLRSTGPLPARTRRRRAAFGAFHFKREKTLKQLETAIEEGDVSTIDEIAEMVDICELEEEHSAYVHRACEKGSLDVVATLLRHGANVNALGDGNYAPLHVAAKQGNSAMAAILISAGANVDVRSRYERKTPIQVAVQEGHITIVDLLLQNQADVNATDLYGGQALHTACRLGNEQMATLLLDHRALIDSYDNEGWTALHLASEAGHSSMVKYLVEHYANVDSQSKYGRTSLHWACASGHVAVVNELLTGSANANIRDLHDKLALDYASNETIKTLVKIHTDKPGMNKRFVSTIGLYITIDPRLKTDDSEFHQSESAKIKKWSSVSNMSDETFVSRLSDADIQAIEQRHRNRERSQNVPLVIYDSVDSSSLYNTMETGENDVIEDTFRHLVSSTNREIGNLNEVFRDFYSVMAIASDSQINVCRDTIDNAIRRLSSVQQVLETLERNFQKQSNKFLSVMREEKLKSASRGGSPPFIALVAMFNESLLDGLSKHSDPNVWKQFLETLKLPQEIQALLTIRLQFDKNSSTRDKLKHCIMFWARGQDVGADSSTHYMKKLLDSVQECQEGDSDDEVMISEILQDFVKKDTEFRTGSRHDKVANLSKLVQSLHGQETRILLRSLEESSSNPNIFPRLDELQSTYSEVSELSQIADESAKRRRHQDEETLYRKLKDILEEEDMDHLVMVVKFLILCGREDLLGLLL